MKQQQDFSEMKRMQACREQAAAACNMLRKQLRDQEMSRHIENMYAYKESMYTQQPFVFVSRKELKDEIEKRVEALITK